MNKRYNRIQRTACLLILITLLVSTVSVSLAWFVDARNGSVPVTASSMTKYFFSGDGTEEHPYTINAAKHLYNLAWLQNRGRFNNVDRDGDGIPDPFYFELISDLDMAGELKGATNYSGAVPPIGSQSKPFTGIFNGGGHTISNLWVSSDPNDWAEKPAIKEPVGPNIGFFGETGGGANISNFVLKNIEVTVAQDAAVTGYFTVGLVAGKLDSDISNVGVDGGKLDLKGVRTKSESSLIGERGEGVNWVESPQGAATGGNSLYIDPSQNYNGVAANTYAEVSGAADDNAHYIGTLTKATSNPKDAGYFRKYRHIDLDDPNDPNNGDVHPSAGLNGEIIWRAGSNDVCISNNLGAGGNTFQPVAADIEITMAAAIYRFKQNLPYIMMGGDVSKEDLQTIEAQEDLLNVPKNGIWFRPQNAGTCHVAITKTNNGNNIESLSLYSYRRVTQADLDGGYVGTLGAINADTWAELKLQIAKGVYGTTYVAFFDIVIPEEAISGEYEFFIGRSQNEAAGITAGFLYLVLPGVGKQGYKPNNPTGDGILYTMEDVDFTTIVDNSYPVLSDPYTPKNILLEINKTESAVTDSLYYWMPDTTHVNYYEGATGTITEKINTDPPTAVKSATLPPEDKQRQTQISTS